MGNNIDKRSILDRVKDHYSLKGNAELARFLGVSPNTITNWYNRETLDIDAILAKCNDIDLNWLLTGHGNRTKDVPPFCTFDAPSSQNGKNKQTNQTICEYEVSCDIIENNRDFLDTFRCEWMKGLKPTNYEYIQIACYNKMSETKLNSIIDSHVDEWQEAYNNNVALHRVLYSLNPPDFLKDKFKPMKPFDVHYKNLLSEFDEDIQESIGLKDNKLKNILFILYLKENIEHANRMIGILINYMDTYNDLIIKHILDKKK